MTAVDDYYRIAKSGKKSYSRANVEQAINRRCIECRYDNLAKGSMPEQVGACDATDCPLFPHRMKSDNRDGELPVVNPEDSKEWRRKIWLIRDHQSKGTSSEAVIAYCIDCNFDNHERGSWREQVRQCNVKKCDLWSVRPK